MTQGQTCELLQELSFFPDVTSEEEQTRLWVDIYIPTQLTPPGWHLEFGWCLFLHRQKT